MKFNEETGELEGEVEIVSLEHEHIVYASIGRAVDTIAVDLSKQEKYKNMQRSDIIQVAGQEIFDYLVECGYRTRN